MCCKRMSGVKARKWVVRSHFVGQPKREDLEIVEEELSPIKDGGQEVEGRGSGCARRTRFMCVPDGLHEQPYECFTSGGKK